MIFDEITAEEYINRSHEFGATLDVRSPAEFDESHIPNSRNIFALTNDERTEIGTLHARSPFEAKLLGASFVCKNLSHHLPSLDLTPAEKIAIYCARGQMRSGSVATVLSSIGFRVWRIKGGYKSYRKAVLDFFAHLADRKLIILDGLTGSGKSEIINSIDWSVDLEGFAGHKGSVFGGVGVRQKNQKMFENLLMHRLMRSDGTLLVESESKNIGKVTIPTAFHDLMQKSVRIYLSAPLDQRIARIVNDYKMITTAEFERAMGRIAPFMKATILNEVKTAFYKGDLAKTAEILLVDYYDLVYKKHTRNEFTIDFTTLEETKKKIEAIRSSL